MWYPVPMHERGSSSSSYMKQTGWTHRDWGTVWDRSLHFQQCWGVLLVVLPIPLPQLPNTPLCLAKEHGLSEIRTVFSCLQTKQTCAWVTYLHMSGSRQSTNRASFRGLNLARDANVLGRSR